MEFAAVSFALLYKHSRHELEIYIDKLQLRPHALSTMPWVANCALSVHATLLPVNKRVKSAERRMKDLYFVYMQYFTLSKFKSTEIGSMGLRLRLYVRRSGVAQCTALLPLADACLNLRGMSLTSEISEFVLVLTDDCCDYRVKLFVQKEEALYSSKNYGFRRGRGIKGLSRVEEFADSEPTVAVQLNYDTISRHIVIHLQRATHLTQFERKRLFFQVLVMLPDRHVIYKARTKTIAPEAVNILHNAFQIPVTPRQCREVTLIIQLLSPVSSHGRKSKHAIPLAHVSFGRCSSSQNEREHFLEAFKDELPTKMVPFPLRKMGVLVIS